MDQEGQIPEVALVLDSNLDLLEDLEDVAKEKGGLLVSIRGAILLPVMTNRECKDYKKHFSYLHWLGLRSRSDFGRSVTGASLAVSSSRCRFSGKGLPWSTIVATAAFACCCRRC